MARGPAPMKEILSWFGRGRALNEIGAGPDEEILHVWSGPGSCTGIPDFLDKGPVPTKHEMISFIKFRPNPNEGRSVIGVQPRPKM